MTNRTERSSQVKRVWEWLIRPHPSVTDTDQQRYAQWLMVFALIGGAASLAGMVANMTMAAIPHRQANVLILLAITGLSLLSYALGRTRFYRGGATLLAVGLSAGIYARISIAPSQPLQSLMFITVVIIVSSALLSTRQQMALTLFNTLAPLALLAFVPGFQPTHMVLASGNFATIGALGIVIGHFRAATERRRLAEIEAANEKLKIAQATLEQQVAERTAALSRSAETLSHRVNQLQASAQIARAAVTQTNLEQLVPTVVELIRERFDFYHVSLFLLDADNRFAALQYGSGDAGRLMKERGYRLQVNDRSAVGWACAHRQARLALDVGAEAVRFDNPLLPDTRSELALPLRAGERILGALDVHSTRPAAFDQEDVAVLQGLADQIAVALENARLFQQTQAALQELERSSRLLTQQGWQAYLDQAQVVRRAEFRPQQAPATGPLSRPLAIPLELRGQTIGRLTLRRESERAWTDNEVQIIQTIAAQAALAADNARLMEQTQKALQETQGLFQAARAITEATQVGQLETLCQKLADHFNDLLRAHTTRITLVDHDRRQIVVRVSSGRVSDVQLRMTYAELNSGIGGIVLKTGRPVLSLDADDGIEPEATRQRRKQANIGPMIIAPLIIKGKTSGLISIYNLIGQPRFSQRDVEMIMALSAQAATAIENIRLLEETQRRAERERLLRQITTRIRAAADIEGILKTTAAELAQSLGVPRAIVRLTTSGDTQTGKNS